MFNGNDASNVERLILLPVNPPVGQTAEKGNISLQRLLSQAEREERKKESGKLIQL
jgi:hypothetical protein